MLVPRLLRAGSPISTTTTSRASAVGPAPPTTSGPAPDP